MANKYLLIISGMYDSYDIRAALENSGISPADFAIKGVNEKKVEKVV